VIDVEEVHCKESEMLDPRTPAVFLLCCIVESVAYGMAVILFCSAMMGMIRQRAPNRILFMSSASLLLLLTTLHLIGVCIRTYEAFIIFPLGPKAYYELLSTKENLVAQIGQVGSILLTDLLTVFRVYQFCQASTRGVFFLRLALASCAFIGTFVSGVAFVQIQRVTDPHESYFEQNVFQWTLSFLASSLLTTALSTGIITFELWKGGHQTKRNTKEGLFDDSEDGDGLFTRVLWIFVESAALYSLNNLIYLALFAGHSVVEGLFSSLAAPIASMTFSAIILRLQKAAVPAAPRARGSNNNALLTHASRGSIEDLALRSMSPRTQMTVPESGI